MVFVLDVSGNEKARRVGRAGVGKLAGARVRGSAPADLRARKRERHEASASDRNGAQLDHGPQTCAPMDGRQGPSFKALRHGGNLLKTTLPAPPRKP
jgi:hypothetical protein